MIEDEIHTHTHVHIHCFFDVEYIDAFAMLGNVGDYLKPQQDDFNHAQVMKRDN